MSYLYRMKNRYWEVGYKPDVQQFLLVRHNKFGRWVETISLDIEELMALQSYLTEYKITTKQANKKPRK